jgi:hypothetical protein
VAVQFVFSTTADVTRADTAAKTVLLVGMPTKMSGQLKEIQFSCDGTPAATAGLLEICSSTEATAGTSTGAATITQTRGRTPIVWATDLTGAVSGYGYTAEGTVVSMVKPFKVQLGSLIVIPYPLGAEFELLGGVGYLLRFTPPVATSMTIRASMDIMLGAT